MSVCRNCEKPLINDEIAVYKKLVSREAQDFLCKECLAEHFKVEVEVINRKIEQFKLAGCLLFFPEKIPPQIK